MSVMVVWVSGGKCPVTGRRSASAGTRQSAACRLVVLVDGRDIRKRSSLFGRDQAHAKAANERLYNPWTPAF